MMKIGYNILLYFDSNLLDLEFKKFSLISLITYSYLFCYSHFCTWAVVWSFISPLSRRRLFTLVYSFYEHHVGIKGRFLKKRLLLVLIRFFRVYYFIWGTVHYNFFSKLLAGTNHVASFDSFYIFHMKVVKEYNTELRIKTDFKRSSKIFLRILKFLILRTWLRS